MSGEELPVQVLHPAPRVLAVWHCRVGGLFLPVCLPADSFQSSNLGKQGFAQNERRESVDSALFWSAEDISKNLEKLVCDERVTSLSNSASAWFLFLEIVLLCDSSSILY